MALDTHTSGRGGRKARKINDDRRKSDRLKSDGVLHNDETLANRVYAEAINCPICHKRVHPTNFNQHMSNDHPNGKPLHEVTERLPLAAIRTDGGTQPRAAINAETITEYAEAIQDGATFPALVACTPITSLSPRHSTSIKPNKSCRIRAKGFHRSTTSQA